MSIDWDNPANFDAVRENLPADLRLKIEARVLAALAGGEGSIADRVTDAAYAAVEEGKTLGWSEQALEAMVFSFLVIATELIDQIIASSPADAHDMVRRKLTAAHRKGAA